MEWACGCGARRLQRVAHGCGQIICMIVHRHENLPPAPKGDIGQRGQALAGEAASPDHLSPKQRGNGRDRSRR
jgi:hypothetical protein